MSAPPADPVLVDRVVANLDRLRDRLARAGADPDLRVVAVTKRQPLEVVRAAAAAGLTDVGENYAQELVAKATGWGEEGGPPLRWHMVGGLQSNKVRMLAPHVHLLQSVDRPSLIRPLALAEPRPAVLVQVDLAGLPGRGGCAPADTAALVAALVEAGVEVRGLMGVAGPGVEDAEGRRRVEAEFGMLARLADELGLAERSMGMSDDLEIAVACGSTMVRVGTALFGARP